MKANRTIHIWLIVVTCVVAAPGVAAQSFAAKPLRLIVPYAPGGLDASSEQGSLRDANDRESAAATGYTLFMGTANFSMAVSLFSKLPFDPVRDFTAVSLLAKSPSLLAVNPALPANS